MFILKWLMSFLDLIPKLLKLPFQDNFYRFLKHNVGQPVQVKINGEWVKGIILKLGKDYVALMIGEDEFFYPISQIQAIRLTEI